MKTDVKHLEDRVKNVEDRIKNVEEKMVTKTELAEFKASLYRALWMQTGAIIVAVVALVKLLS